MKKIVSLLLVLMLALSSAVAVGAEGIKDIFGTVMPRGTAVSYPSGDTTVTIDPSTHTITVSGTGSMADYDNPHDDGDSLDLSPYIQNAPDVNEEYDLVVASGVTHIGDYAFTRLRGGSVISSVTLADTVTSVGIGAFANHALLGNLNIGLRSVKWSSGCSVVGNGVFADCLLLNSITNVSHVTSVGDFAFFRCVLTDSEFAKFTSLRTISPYAFNGCFQNVVLPSSVRTIGDSAFGAVETCTFNEGLTTIGNRIFDRVADDHPYFAIGFNYNYYSFDYAGMGYVDTSPISTGEGLEGASVVIPSTVTSIGDQVFYGLESIDFGNNTTVTLEPPTVISRTNRTTITEGSITNVSTLGYATVAYVNASSGSSIHDYVDNNRNGVGGLIVIEQRSTNYSFISNNTVVTIDPSAHTITVSPIAGTDGRMADYENSYDYESQLASVQGYYGPEVTPIWHYDNYTELYGYYDLIVESGVTHVGSYSFMKYYFNNNNLIIRSVTLSDTVTSVGNGAFAGNHIYSDGLKSVRWSSGCSTIGDGVFADCYLLNNITNVSHVTSLGEFALYMTSLTDSEFAKFKNLQTIGACALDCEFQNIELPASLRTIGDYAFGNGLKTCTFNEGLTTIGNRVFMSLYNEQLLHNYNTDAYCFDYSAIDLIDDQRPGANGGLPGSSIVIPSTVTSIGDSVFANVKDINFGNNTTVSLVPPSVITTRTGICNGSIVHVSRTDVAPTVAYVNAESGSTIHDYVNNYGNDGARDRIIIANNIIEGGPCDATMQGLITWSINVPTKTLMLTYHNDVVASNYGLVRYNPYNYNNGVDLPVEDLNAPWLEYADSIEHVVIGEGITDAGNSNYTRFSHTFVGLTNLKTVSIPSTLTDFSGALVEFCPNLEKFTVAAGNTNLYVDSYGVLYKRNATFSGHHGEMLLRCPQKYTGSYDIPDSVIVIRESAFQGCADLTSVTLGNNVIQSFSNMFSGCTNLVSATLNEGLQAINLYDFAGCSSLKEISIPTTVTNILNHAFYGCTGLDYLMLPASVNFVSDGPCELSGITKIVVLNPDAYNSSTTRPSFISLFKDGDGQPDTAFCNGLTVYGYTGSAIESQVADFNSTNGTSITFVPLTDAAHELKLNTGSGIITRNVNGAVYKLTEADKPADREGYVFAGWYKTAAGASSLNAADAYDTNIILEGSTVDLYAGWIAMGTLTKDANDNTGYTSETFSGFSLEGVQLRDDNEALRFVTVISENMLSSIRGLKNAVCEYGYILYAGSTINGMLTFDTEGAIDLRASSSNGRHFRMFQNYRMSTCAITFETQADREYISTEVEARAYLKYIDANGINRVLYDVYENAQGQQVNAGGCKTSLAQIWELAGVAQQ